MNESLAGWIPSDVLVGVLVVVIGYIIRRSLSDMREIRDSLKNITQEQQSIRLTLKDHATLDQLGRMGDRFDGRMTNLAKEVAVIQAVLAKVT